jgi:hypothetical protein
MPDLAAMLVRRYLGALPPGIPRCAGCRRIPLPGELVHELDSGKSLCDLCFAELPEERRLAVRTERVHASERPLEVVPKAV